MDESNILDKWHQGSGKAGHLVFARLCVEYQAAFLLTREVVGRVVGKVVGKVAGKVAGKVVGKAVGKAVGKLVWNLHWSSLRPKTDIPSSMEFIKGDVLQG